MPPRNAPVMTRFSTSAPLASSTASPLLLAPVELVMRGCDARLVDPATGGPPGTSGAPSATTAGPSPISRCPGLSAMPPSSGGTESGDASTTIVSPGPDAAWTTARLLNGALALPSPPPAALALTYQRRWAPRPLPSLSVRSAIAAPATMSVATLPSNAALTIERTRGVITAFPLDVLCADVLRAAGRGQRRSPRPRRHRAVAGERSLGAAMGRERSGAARRGEKKGRDRGSASREMPLGERHRGFLPAGFGAIGSVARPTIFDPPHRRFWSAPIQATDSFAPTQTSVQYIIHAQLRQKRYQSRGGSWLQRRPFWVRWAALFEAPFGGDRKEGAQARRHVLAAPRQGDLERKMLGAVGDLLIDDAGMGDAAHLARQQRHAHPRRDQAHHARYLRGLKKDARIEPGIVAGEQEFGLQARNLIRREDHELLVGDVGEAHGLRPGQAVPGRQHRDQPLALDDAQLEVAGIADGQAQDADIDAAGEQVVHLLLGEQLAQIDLDARESRTQVAQDARHQLVAQRTDEAHDDPPDQALARLARLVDGAVALGEQAARLGEEHAARRRELDRALGAGQQLDADRLLKPLDGVAQRRLRHMEPRRGAAEMELLGDDDELRQPAQRDHGIRHRRSPPSVANARAPLARVKPEARVGNKGVARSAIAGGRQRLPLQPREPAPDRKRRWRPPLARRHARQQLQHMAVGVAEIDAAATVPGVELPVLELPGRAAVSDAGGTDARQDGVELVVSDMEDVVMDLELALLGVAEIEGQRRVDLDRREMPARRVIGEAEDVGEPPRRRPLVERRHDGVVQGDNHGVIPDRVAWRPLTLPSPHSGEGCEGLARRSRALPGAG